MVYRNTLALKLLNFFSRRFPCSQAQLLKSTHLAMQEDGLSLKDVLNKLLQKFSLAKVQKTSCG